VKGYGRAVKKTVNQKLGDLIRRMSSPHEGEVIASALALRRTLVAAGRDFHEIADAVENGHGGKLSEAEMRKLYNAGFEAGLAEGESRHITTFRNVSSAGDYEMAQYIWERIERLPQRHHHFVEGMLELSSEDELTPKQHAYLQSLYRQVGGKP
jgi:hypothetical protein